MTRFRPHLNRGSMLLEATLAVTIAITASVAVAQILAISVRQRVESRWRATATIEAANLMEHIARLPWNELNEQRLQSVRAAASETSQLPEPTVELTLTETQDDLARKQIEIRFEWSNLSGLKAQPIELVAWRYSQGEPE